MDDIAEAIKNRLSSPLLGYYSLALLAINWEAIFYLLVQDGDVETRIAFFESHTSGYSLLLWPLLASIAFIAVYPWILLALSWLTAAPIQRQEKLRATAEHNLLLVKKDLEDTRTRLFAGAEAELIARAKRDEEVQDISSDEVRARLQAELDALRIQRDDLRAIKPPTHSSDDFIHRIVQSRKFRLFHNPKVGPERSKEIRFEPGGQISDGRNKFENTWRVFNGCLELVQADGEVHSRFAYLPESGIFIHTGDADTKSARGQYIIPEMVG